MSFITNRWPGRADRLNAQGIELEEEGRLAEAERLYREAIKVKPDWSFPWFNLGLLCKRQRRWPESLRYNLKATELNPADEAAWWNLGIAATALGDWRQARAAWTGFGLEIPPGEGELNLDYGLVPIRLDPEDAGEVVWCARIDPARAIIKNIPFAESNHRWGDLVLHDGEPRGHRIHGGEEVPVFDELELIAASELSTYAAIVAAPAEADSSDLEDLARQRDLAAEDWSANTRMICKACSEGTPHEHHDAPEAPWEPQRHFALAAPDQASAIHLLEEWVAGGQERSYDSLELLLAGELRERPPTRH